MDLFEIEEKPHDSYEVADEISLCLDAALSEIGVEVTVPHDQNIVGFYPDNIRVNKLSYMAIEKFDLPLIRTWYKYGQYEPYESLRADGLSSQPYGDENTVVYDPPHRNPVTRDAIYSFFLDKENLIESIWEYDLYDFMKFNYGMFAPEKVKEMYIANTGFLHSIEKLYTGRYNHADDYGDLKKSLMNLRYELEESPTISQEISDSIIDFLFTFEDVLEVYNSIDSPTMEQRKLMKSTMNLYHLYIWDSPSLEIAISNMDGPDEDKHSYKNRLKGHIPEAKDTLDERISKWESGVERAELTPKTTTSVSGSFEIGELGKASTNMYSQNDSR